MSETRDKRRRNDLDLFVLALIDNGVSTPYELKTTAGLSPGATVPVLRRLLESHLVRSEKPGARGRIDHRITAEGRRHLISGWRALIDDGPSGDLDADLRVALLAVWIGGDRRLAADFLRQSAAQRLETICNAERPDGPASLPSLAMWYRKLRSTSVVNWNGGLRPAVISPINQDQCAAPFPVSSKIHNPYSSVTPVTSDGETARVYSRHHWADGFARLISLPDESPPSRTHARPRCGSTTTGP